MSNIFNGFLFIFISFNLAFGTVRIDMIPDFVGYIFMIKGLGEMAAESARYLKIRPFAIGMCAYTFILFIVNLFGSVSIGRVITDMILALISTITSLYIAYNIVMGVRDLEYKYDREFNAAVLYEKWIGFVFFSFAPILLIFLPILNLISIIAALVVIILFLVEFNKTVKLYNAMF